MAKVQFNCRLTEATIKKIKRLSKERGISQADVIENWATTLDVLKRGDNTRSALVQTANQRERGKKG